MNCDLFLVEDAELRSEGLVVYVRVYGRERYRYVHCGRLPVRQGSWSTALACVRLR